VGNIKLGLNLEFARLENQGFDWAMDQAAEIGYKYIEPMVHWGRELLSAAGYFHSRSMLDDPLILKKAAEDRGLKISSLSSHAPLAKPDVAVEYLRQSIRASRPPPRPVAISSCALTWPSSNSPLPPKPCPRCWTKQPPKAYR
jgi:sugar phosphate isomerase/epimerase